MGTTGIQVFIILVYIGVLFGISWYVKHKAAASAEAYVLAGRKLTTPLIMVSIVGLAVGGASTIGVAEQAYKVGLSAGWYTAAWGIGAIVMGLTVAKKYRQLNITTVAELLERYYDRRSMIAGIGCQVLVQLVIMSLRRRRRYPGCLDAEYLHAGHGDAHQCRRLHRHYPYRWYVVGQPV